MLYLSFISWLICLSWAIAEPSLVSREAVLLQVAEARHTPLEAFKRWAEEHGKGYVDDEAAFSHRFSIWKDNMDMIEKYNSENPEHWLGVTIHADMTNEEFRAERLGLNKSAAAPTHRRPRHSGITSIEDAADKMEDFKYPPEVDWVRRGAVTEVKNQETCGACWAFSTTGAIEGINYIYSKDLVSLSEQELVDCDAVDNACDGGVMDHAFQWVVDNGGIEYEVDYSYHASLGKCLMERKKRHVVSIQGFADVEPASAGALVAAAARQPVSVAVDASSFAFQHYRGGVLSDCTSNINHGVLLVGYGTDASDTDFWKVKNSWGPYWGEHGFIRIKRDMSWFPLGSYGTCGILSMSSYPIKTQPNPDTPCCQWIPFVNICWQYC